MTIELFKVIANINYMSQRLPACHVEQQGASFDWRSVFLLQRTANNFIFTGTKFKISVVCYLFVVIVKHIHGIYFSQYYTSCELLKN